MKHRPDLGSKSANSFEVTKGKSIHLIKSKCRVKFKHWMFVKHHHHVKYTCVNVCNSQG